MVLQKLIPQVKVSNIMGFLTSKEVIVAGAAIIGVPLLLSQAQNLIQKIPFLRDHFTVAFLLLGFIIAALATMVGGIFRIALLGIGAGFAVTAVAPRIRDLISQVRNR